MKANVEVGVWSSYDYCPVNHPRLSGVKQHPVICSWILWGKNSDGVSRAGLSPQHMELQLHGRPQYWGRLTQMVGSQSSEAFVIHMSGSWAGIIQGLGSARLRAIYMWPWVVWASHSRRRGSEWECPKREHTDRPCSERTRKKPEEPGKSYSVTLTLLSPCRHKFAQFQCWGMQIPPLSGKSVERNGDHFILSSLNPIDHLQKWPQQFFSLDPPSAVVPSLNDIRLGWEIYFGHWNSSQIWCIYRLENWFCAGTCPLLLLWVTRSSPLCA